MQHERSQEPELAGLESQLAELVPRVEIDRDRFMFAAGARSTRGKLLVMNRLLAAACVLLAVTTLAPLVLRERGGEVAHEEEVPNFADRVAEGNSERTAAANHLPNQLIVADSRELAAALAEGQDDLRPARLHDTQDKTNGPEFTNSAARARPKSSRALLREYLDANGTRL